MSTKKSLVINAACCSKCGKQTCDCAGRVVNAFDESAHPRGPDGKFGGTGGGDGKGEVSKSHAHAEDAKTAAGDKKAAHEEAARLHKEASAKPW